jgi:valyl-tRNA synthetase
VWPTASELRAVATDLPRSAGAASVLGVATDVLRQIRKAKSDAKRSMRAEVAKVTVADTRARLPAFAAPAGDVRNAGNVANLTTVQVPDDGAARFEVVLDNPEAASSRA